MSQKTITNTWNEAKDVNLFQEWIVTTRFQILRTKLPEGFKWVQGSPMIQRTRPGSIWPEAWTIKQETKRDILQIGPRKVPNWNQQAATGESGRSRPTTRVTSRLLRLV